MIRKSSVYRKLQIGLVLSQFLPGALLTVEAAQLVFENTFENGLGNLEYMAAPMQPAGCESKKWSRVPDPAGGGGYVLKVLQQGGNECLTANDAKHRAMVGPKDAKGDRVSYAPRTEYWVGYRIYIPSDFETKWLKDTNSDIIHFQTVRGAPHGETPQIHITSSDGLTVQLEFHHMYINNSGPFYVNKIKVGLNRGAWNSIIMNFRHETDATGYLKAWVNGALKVDVTGQTDTLPSIKPYTQYDHTNMGLYWGITSRPHDWTIYLDNWRIATGTGGFDVVNPGNDSLAAPAPPVAPTNLQLQVQ